jgi:hypothetical protein
MAVVSLLKASGVSPCLPERSRREAARFFDRMVLLEHRRLSSPFSERSVSQLMRKLPQVIVIDT